MEEVIIIGGRSYLANDPHIHIDCITGEKIHIGDQLTSKVYRRVVLHREIGYIKADLVEYTRTPLLELANHNCILIACKRGTVALFADGEIEGGGQIFPDPEKRNVYYDEPTWAKKRGLVKNKANKFRAFNAQVKPFDQYNNILIPQEDKKKMLKRDIKFGVKSLTYKMFEGLNKTFGVELETSSGRLEEVDTLELNLKCEFDGSLRDEPGQRKEDVLGGEYITGVLIGDAGMHQLHKICNKLNSKCTINKQCGVHVHIGSLIFNKENIVFMYLLGVMIQNEIFKLLPMSRRNNAYCRGLKSLNLNPKALLAAKGYREYKIVIDQFYATIFKEVSHGAESTSKWNKKTNHPLGSKCGYDKNTQRYCWLNFVTAIFNTKDNGAYTLEFRPFQATVNYKEVKYWVKICMAIAAFAETHHMDIMRGWILDTEGNKFPISLNSIMNVMYPRTAKLLIEWMDERKNFFSSDMGDKELEDYQSDKEECKELTIKESVCA